MTGDDLTPKEQLEAALVALGATAEDVGDQVAFPYTDLGNARRLIDQHGDDLRYVAEWGAWLHWDGHRWAEDALGEVDRRAHAVVDAFYTEALAMQDPDNRKRMIGHWSRTQGVGRMRAMVDVARSLPGVAIHAASLDADPWLFNTASGVVNLRTGLMLAPEAAKRQMVTKMSPARWEPGATCPRWDAFVSWALGDDVELIAFVRRWAGYSMTGLTTEQAMLILNGDGSNGKSTLVGLLLWLFGAYATAAAPNLLMQTIGDQHPAGIADLAGARLVSAMETEEGKRLSEVIVKQLIGGDVIKTRRMRENFYEFVPLFKLWMSTNHRPRIVGTDVAIWRRIHLVPFVATVADADKNVRLPDELRTEAEGVLQWCMAGLTDWRDCGGLRPPGAVLAASADYRTEEDHAGRFIADCCIIDPDCSITSRELRVIYETWCSENGEHPFTAKRLGDGIRRRGGVPGLGGTGYARMRVWNGIGSSDNPTRRFRTSHFVSDGIGTHGTRTEDVPNVPIEFQKNSPLPATGTIGTLGTDDDLDTYMSNTQIHESLVYGERTGDNAFRVPTALGIPDDDPMFGDDQTRNDHPTG